MRRVNATLGVNVPGDYERRLQRRKEIANRAKVAGLAGRRCAVVGCARPTRATAGTGLNERFCKAHEEHQQRHGSPFKGSYSAAELNPYRRAAFDWLTANADSFFVKGAIAGVHGL